MTWFLIPAIALAIQSVWSLRGGFRFLALIRRKRSGPIKDYQPPAAVIIPCKGIDDDLARNMETFLSQDYGRYDLILAVASERDPAHQHLREILGKLQPTGGKCPRHTSLIVAGYSETNGEKVNNLLAGVSTVAPDVEVLIFADIDARPARGWLRALVAPLQDPNITVSTGYRWYLPSRSCGSRLRAAWDASIATMMGEHNHNFAWGGSMAIRVADFTRLKIAEHYWQGTLSDDYAMTRAVREARGSIHFEPRCLVASGGDCTMKEFLCWTNRQIIITRVYAPHYWRMGLASYSLYALTFVWGLVLMALARIPLPFKITAAAFLGGILILGAAKGKLRSIVARELFSQETPDLRRYTACYWRLAAVTPWVMFFNFIFAGFARRIEWSGTTYELKSVDEVQVLRRERIAKHRSN
jgi:ceramide glucosyltransferase